MFCHQRTDRGLSRQRRPVPVAGIGARLSDELASFQKALFERAQAFLKENTFEMSTLNEVVAHFKERTGCGVLVNTSFNVRGEPIVCTPEDAWRCFMGTELDLLVAGNCVVRKAEQDPAMRSDYTSDFALD